MPDIRLNRRRIRLIVPLLTACLTAAAFAQDEAPAERTWNLKPSWKNGQTSRYQATTTKTTTLSSESRPEPIVTKSTYKSQMTWTVLEANPDGGGKCQLTITDLVVEMTSPRGEKVTIDRNTSEERFKDYAQYINAFLDSPITMTVSASGDVSDLQGIDAIKAKAGEAGERITNADFHEIATDLAVLTGGAASLKPQAEWKRKFDWSHEMGTLHYDSTYRFAGVEQIEGFPIALINRKSGITFTLDQKQLPEEGPEISIQLTEGTSNTQVMFDTTRHETVGLNADSRLVFQTNVTFNGRSFSSTRSEVFSTQLLRLAEK